MKNVFRVFCSHTNVKYDMQPVAKRVSWDDDVKVHVYFLEEGEVLGRLKVKKEKFIKMHIPDDHKDLIESVCGVDTVCKVYVAPKRVEKAQDVDLLAALGML